MDINQIVENLRNLDIVYLFFKAFAVLLSFLYLIYAIVILKQVQTMNATVRGSISSLISIVSFVQLIVGLLLVILAIFTV